MKELHP